MKRSNLFLGASAFVLAIAGAFASKASNKYTGVACWSSSGGVGVVANNQLSSSVLCDNSQINTCKTTSSFRTCYTRDAITHKATAKLHTGGQ